MQTTRTISRVTEYALWVAGLLAIAAYALAQVQTARAQAAAMVRLEADFADTPPPSLTPEVSKADQMLWSANRVEAHARAGGAGDALVPLAILSVPAVDIRVAMFDGTSDRALNLGVGRIPGTAQIDAPGNLGVAGHRDGFFRGLKDLSVGDEIVLQRAGAVQRFTVTGFSIVAPEDISVLAPTVVPAITLVTCYPFYFVGKAPQRFVVRAEQREETQLSAN